MPWLFPIIAYLVGAIPFGVIISRARGIDITKTPLEVAPGSHTWLGGLEPFIWAAGIGTPVFLLWVIFDAIRTYRRLTSAGARKSEESGNATDTG